MFSMQFLYSMVVGLGLVLLGTVCLGEASLGIPLIALGLGISLLALMNFYQEAKSLKLAQAAGTSARAASQNLPSR